MLAEALGLDAFRERVKIYATDVDEQALSIARQATYNATEVEGVAAEHLERYFERQDNRYTFRSGYPADGFHTYTTEWDANSLKWYIDGKLVWTRDKSTTSWYDKVFHKPYNIRLNFQVGGWLGNPDASTQFPADFVVDYVRVYQR